MVKKQQICGANKKTNVSGRASVQSQGFTTHDETLINTQRGGGSNVAGVKDQEAPPVVVSTNPYRRKTSYQAPGGGGKVRTGRMTTSKTEMLINGTTNGTENLSQTGSNKTGGENSRSIGADGGKQQRRRRGDRSKGETATTQGSSASGQKTTTSAHFKKLFSKNVMLGRVKTPSTQATLAVTA